MQLGQYVEFVKKILNATLSLDDAALMVVIGSSAEVRLLAYELTKQRIKGAAFLNADVQTRQVSQALRHTVDESYALYKSLGVRKIEKIPDDFLPSDAAKILVKSIELPGSGLAFNGCDPFTQTRAVQALISFEIALINILIGEVLDRDPITIPERRIA